MQISGAQLSGVTMSGAVSSIVTSGLQLYLDAGNASSYPGSGTTWTDLTANGRNGTQGSLFLNGSQVGTTDPTSNQTLFATNDFYFGARHGNDGTGSSDYMNNAAFYPVFYQMRVYNKALSGAEITQNYNAVKGTYGL